ncbi:hypothetical protein ACU4GD_15880 [Cupriavidus basilensis]
MTDAFRHNVIEIEAIDAATCVRPGTAGSIVERWALQSMAARCAWSRCWPISLPGFTPAVGQARCHR